MPLPYYVGLVAGAPDADNGKKLIDFLLAKEAQSTVSSIAHRRAGAQGRPRRPTPTSPSCTSAMKGVTVWTPDWAAVLKDLPADVARWQQATGS